jgi:hypothetical protein
MSENAVGTGGGSEGLGDGDGEGLLEDGTTGGGWVVVRVSRGTK